MSKQIREAVIAYFQEDLKQVIGDPYWVPLDEQKAIEHASAAAKSVSEEMDDCIKKVDVSDHCVHWVADLTVQLDDYEEVIEVPFNRVDPSKTHALQVYEFLNALVKAAVAECGSKSLNIAQVNKVSAIIDEAINRCEGCSANMALEEALFRADNLYFRFSAVFSDGTDKTYRVYFDVPWPLT